MTDIRHFWTDEGVRQRTGSRAQSPDRDLGYRLDTGEYVEFCPRCDLWHEPGAVSHDTDTDLAARLARELWDAPQDAIIPEEAPEFALGPMGKPRHTYLEWSADQIQAMEGDPAPARPHLPDRTEEILTGLFDRVEETLARKREDYGTDNINQTGLVGVAVRLVDKTARLHHLVSSGREPNHESIQDTVEDIVGYAGIFQVLLEGEQW